MADGAKKGARRVEQSIHGALQENPMAVGAAVLALGAVVGFSLPRTPGEDSLMGETGDHLLSQAGDAAHDAVAAATQFAEEKLEPGKKQEGTSPSF